MFSVLHPRLCTGIESIKWKMRQEHSEMKVENPRSGTTDHVECMFSILRDLIGKHFTVREWRYAWRKICLEFSKRLDPYLGVYYFMLAHDRLYEGERPEFNKSCKQGKKTKVMIGSATLVVSRSHLFFHVHTCMHTHVELSHALYSTMLYLNWCNFTMYHCHFHPQLELILTSVIIHTVHTFPINDVYTCIIKHYSLSRLCLLN